jgi:hypothetical protein
MPIEEGGFVPKRAVEHAARHHKEAAKHHEAGNYLRATHHAHLACGHHQLANRHSAEAAKAHVEHYGDMIISPATLATVTEEMALPRMAQSAKKATEGQRKHPT